MDLRKGGVGGWFGSASSWDGWGEGVRRGGSGWDAKSSIVWTKKLLPNKCGQNG